MEKVDPAIWREKTGGPAFPTKGPDGDYLGLTALDYFAGQALAGLLAERGNSDVGSFDLSKIAYSHAEAMLAERARRAGEADNG